MAQRITDLVTETRTLTERLVRLEIERARSGFQRAASRAATGVGLLVAGAVIALVALGTFTAAAVLGLATAMPAWAAALIVGAIAAVVAALLIMFGTSRVRSATAVAPDEVVQPIKEDARWLAQEQADIERDIELTREQLAHSISELTVRLDPRRGIRTAAVATGAVVVAAVALVVWRRW